MRDGCLKAYKLTALSAWALYLINGDASGLELDEQHQIEAWLANEGFAGNPPVSCEDAGFRWRHDASNYSLAGDCQEYIFLVTPSDPLYALAE